MANNSETVAFEGVLTHTMWNNLRTDAIGPYGDDRIYPDDIKALFGTGSDIEQYFDGVNLIITSASNFSVLVGTTTNNSFQSLGITIDQGGNGDEIAALKSSGGVAHGMTDLTNTDTYGIFRKINSSTGGLRIGGVSEGTTAAQLYGHATSTSTDKSSTGRGAVELIAQKKSGTTVTGMSVGENMVAFLNNDTTHFVFDASGRMWMSGNPAFNGVTVSAQASAIADVSGGSTVDAEARTAINSVLTMLRDTGLIAT